MNINEIEPIHINRLDPVQLTKLLHNLLKIELRNNKLSGEAFVPYNINTGDEGDDGRIEWNGGPEETFWLKKRLCLFQNKATNLSEGNCYNELLRKPKDGEPKTLKILIADLVKKNGCYTLFTNQMYNKIEKDRRIARFREAIKDCGYANHETLVIKIYDANSISSWVNEDIGSVALVQKFNGITRIPFTIWQDWAKSFPGINIKFFRDDLTNERIKIIQDSAKKGKPIRIIGHSGLGKMYNVNKK